MNRRKIINAILSKTLEQTIDEQSATLEFALEGLQDALLIELAEDLDCLGSVQS